MVLATEKKQKSILYDERSVHKVEPITKHIGLVYSGMGPDYRYNSVLFGHRLDAFSYCHLRNKTRQQLAISVWHHIILYYTV